MATLDQRPPVESLTNDPNHQKKHRHNGPLGVPH